MKTPSGTMYKTTYRNIIRIKKDKKYSILIMGNVFLVFPDGLTNTDYKKIFGYVLYQLSSQHNSNLNK